MSLLTNILLSIVVIATAYTADVESTGKTPDHPAYGITASGKRVQENHTIACPPEWPFGTTVFVEGLGIRVCEDRGGAIKENRIDIYMPNKEDALAWGRRKVRVIFLTWGDTPLYPLRYPKRLDLCSFPAGAGKENAASEEAAFLSLREIIYLSNR